MRILLGAGTLVDIRDQSQATPLYRAAAKGDLLGVKLLLNHGANPSLSNSVGCNALQQAAGRGFNEIVQTLLDRGADIDAYDASSACAYPALNVAVTYNKPTTVRLLLQRGADINIQTYTDGQILPTALHIATGKRLLQVLETLLQYKPNLEPRDSHNRTPLIIARQSLDGRIAQRLLTAGADIKAADESLDVNMLDLLWTKNFPMLQVLVDNGAKFFRATLTFTCCSSARFN